MRDYIGPYRASTTGDFLELALGTVPELWLGEPGENDQERAARIAAARDIIADDPEILDRLNALAADAASGLLNALAPPASRSRSAAGRRAA
ncbi:hypothetical protein [Streptacidiphilus carbonis]|uniref:hypothetical protein n=1 Tax=Streptacidiphilus carbonis TaxID=105422 RepID=UPI0005A7D182|nr:hypothetical protein [Streptacidiphilus carbonis]